MNTLQTINGLDILFIIITFVISFRAGINWEKSKQAAIKKRNAKFNRWIDGQTIEEQMFADGWRFPIETRSAKKPKKQAMWDFVVPNSSWKLMGACATIGDPDLWYSSNVKEQRIAKKICYKCPVLAECLVYSFENEEAYGIWGGLTEIERRRARRK